MGGVLFALGAAAARAAAAAPDDDVGAVDERAEAGELLEASGDLAAVGVGVLLERHGRTSVLSE